MLWSWSSLATEPFSPMAAPSTAEWQHFHQMTENKKIELWRFQSGRGVTLAQWAWQWRIGWVRQCERPESLATLCPGLLSAALQDKAVVVRAEAATVIGRRFEKHPNKQIVEELRTAFHDPRNRRGGEPLFVCDRILEALRSIGGRHSIDTATKLAQTMPATKAYWNKLNRVAL
jgi:hypothetical protein